jgi:hypothetical protein
MDWTHLAQDMDKLAVCCEKKGDENSGFVKRGNFLTG